MGASNHPTTRVEPLPPETKLSRLLEDLKESPHIAEIRERHRNMAVIVSDGIWVKTDVLSIIAEHDGQITNDVNGRHLFVIKV